MTTATVALARLASSASQLQRQADNRCAARLAAENVLARIDNVPLGLVQAAAEQAAEEVEQDSGCRVEIATDGFTAGRRDGLHLRVSATPALGQAVTVHDWVFDQTPPTSADNLREAADAN